MKVATVQFQHVAGDITANLAVVKNYVLKAATKNVELVIFPECCLSGYWHLRNLTREQLGKIGQNVPAGFACTQVTELARTYNITIGVGLVEQTTAGTLYNAFFVVNADGTWANHRKLHCFVSQHMDSGDSFTVLDTPSGVRLGILTCYDNNIVENVRATSLLGAQILLAPHQTGGCNSGSPDAMGLIDVDLWEGGASRYEELKQQCNGEKGRGWLLRWLPSRAHDNGLFLIFSNGIGRDDDEVRTGNSMIIDAYGRVMVEAKEPQEQMLVADLDLAMRDRATGTRWIRARRPELYTLLVKNTGNEEETRSVRFEHLDEDANTPD
ncbi:MAG: acyltransferase [Planctomycetaceae bacterium]|jgi:predicted amidohydrolase|nr:acyltransferase [Planctomycetaceae bacterium]MBT4724512.1 acyltransferase [Planctomycetaceae bacterium]MBT5125819.1 acyltransferase [Planctomycetaceae bacterium]MBT5598356.1 acyltransferase [Planctomycetaceae bacterium]MBT5883684.1 acyltransferase [Planctomycetaceae bacterium]